MRSPASTEQAGGMGAGLAARAGPAARTDTRNLLPGSPMAGRGRRRAIRHLWRGGWRPGLGGELSRAGGDPRNWLPTRALPELRRFSTRATARHLGV